jgi:peptide/nickel transport system substrate-binding protein
MDRGNIRKAVALLEEAGWSSEGGVLKNNDETPFTFEILLAAGATEAQSIVDIYVEALRPLGIAPVVTVVDSAQYKERTNSYDFDMAWYTRALSLSPGNEQLLYWGSKGVNEPGSRNWMGMNVPAAEAAIQVMLDSTSQEDFIAATQALDRVLTAGRYVIPIWFSPLSKLAHSKHLHYPDRIPLYGDWPGFQPETWWYED